MEQTTIFEFLKSNGLEDTCYPSQQPASASSDDEVDTKDPSEFDDEYTDYDDLSDDDGFNAADEEGEDEDWDFGDDDDDFDFGDEDTEGYDDEE